MKPNTALIKYKDQPVINLNNVVAIYVYDPVFEDDDCEIKFQYVGEGWDPWSFKTIEEAQSVYKNICSLFVTDLT